MKNIHILPTENPSRIYLIKLNNKLGITSDNPFYTENMGSGTQNQNIYITNDEKIKEDDWCINNINEVFIASNSKSYKHQFKKIILTTDQDLIKDGVQAIDDEFLEWFVKNPSCEEVEINKDNHLFCKHCDTLHSTFGDGINCDVCRRESNPYLKTLGYKIIIPKEEPKQKILYREYLKNSKGGVCSFEQWKKIHENQIKQILIDMIKADEELGLYEEPKQETLEEDAEKYIETSHYMNKDRMADIIFGAKWQQERMYSEEDMIKLFDDYNEYLKDNNFPYIQFEQWLKAFKKE